MINKIHCGNAVEIMKNIQDNSVDLSLTSPPYDCYSNDTEVLTENGWKLIQDVNINEKVLTLNPETDKIYYCDVINKSKYTINEKLISFKNTEIDLFVTKNHKMFVTDKYGDPIRERKPFYKKEKLKSTYLKFAKDIKKSDKLKNFSFKWEGKYNNFFYLPKLTCKYNKQEKVFEEKKIDLIYWVKFMGIYIAEGSVRGSNTKKIPSTYSINIKQKNKKEVDIIRNVIKKLPFNFSEQIFNNITEFTITDRQLWEYLKQFGNSKEKFIPKDIKNLSTNLLNEFLFYYLIGDGTKKEKDIFTDIKSFSCATSFSIKLLNDLQEIYIKLGYYSKIKGYRIFPFFYKKFQYSNMNIKEIHYKGDIVCLEVKKDNIIYVRRNGKSVFCGNSLRTYNNNIKDDVNYDGFSFPFISIVKELFRVTKDGGIVVWIVNDQVKNGGETGSSFKQALKFQELGFKIYDTMIYHKNGASFPETGRYSQVFEYMFVFLKGKKPKTVNLLKDKVNKWAGSTNFGQRSMRQKTGEIKKGKSFIVSDYGYRYNVWYINNGAGYTTKDKFAYEHPALFPESLAEDHILSWSNEGDIVLDPMCGAGTTCKMAKMNHRNFIGIDIEEEYVDISRKRVQVEPYNDENPNKKLEFIISREEILKNRKKK